MRISLAIAAITSHEGGCTMCQVATQLLQKWCPLSHSAGFGRHDERNSHPGNFSFKTLFQN